MLRNPLRRILNQTPDFYVFRFEGSYGCVIYIYIYIYIGWIAIVGFRVKSRVLEISLEEKKDRFCLQLDMAMVDFDTFQGNKHERSHFHWKQTHTRHGSCTAELYEPYTSKCLILSTPVGWFSSSGSLWVAQGAWRIPESALTLQCSWSRNLPSSGRDFNGENLSYNIKPGTSKALNNISSIKHCMSRHSDMYMYVVYYIYILL